MEEAVAWLEKAKRAPRYEPRHFPYINLGRVFAAQGRVEKAIREFESALRPLPGRAQRGLGAFDAQAAHKLTHSACRERFGARSGGLEVFGPSSA